jgi:UDP-N-acetylmuramoyl-tripeptide--D-alanyl-D-alanine ligase
VVAITGSAGKTTVKELLAHVLKGAGAVARNPMNLNNQIGLPLSMLAATGEEKYWVMEAGISLPGDMAELAEILHPDIALVLNVGPAHLSGLGDRGVPYYKAQLLRFLSEGGLGIVSGDYPELVSEARQHCSHLILFTARGRDAPYSGEYLGQDQNGMGRYQLRFEGKSFQVTAPLLGAVGTENVTAVSAVARILGLNEDLIAQGLVTAELPAHRFTRSRVGRWLLVDDSYNSNPLSCASTLKVSSELAAGLPLVLVMGEMGELGNEAEDLHRDLG